MQKSKIPILSFTKPSVTSTHKQKSTAVQIKDKVPLKKLISVEQKKTSQAVLKDKKESKRNLKSSLTENKVLRGKVTSEKCAPASQTHIKDGNKNTLMKTETLKKSKATSKGKIVEKDGNKKTESSKIKSTQSSCVSVCDGKKDNKNVPSQQIKCFYSKTVSVETSRNTTISDQKGETKKKNTAQNSLNHPSQPNIEFVADEGNRNMILSGREMSPSILKHPTLKTSFYDRPSLYNRGSLYQPPIDPHKAALKALENVSLEDRRASAMKKAECLNWKSPFVDRFTPLRSSIDAHGQTIRKLHQLQLKQKIRSTKKVTFKLPDSDSKPPSPEKENIQYRLSVISDKSEGSDQLTPEFNGAILPLPKEVPSSATPKVPVPESSKTEQKVEGPSLNEKNTGEQYEICYSRNNLCRGKFQPENLQSETDENDLSVPCKPSETLTDSESYKSTYGFRTTDPNCRQLSWQKPSTVSEFGDNSYSVKHATTLSSNPNVFLNLYSVSGKEDCQQIGILPIQKPTFVPYAGSSAFNGLRTSISSPDIFGSYADRDENHLKVKATKGFLSNNLVSCCGPGVSKCDDLRMSISSPELRNISYQDPNKVSNAFDCSVEYLEPQASACYASNKNVNSCRKNLTTPRLYTPRPFPLLDQYKNVDSSSPELFGRKISNYIAHAPILTPMVMKSLSNQYDDDDDQYDLSVVRQKLEFRTELKENDNSKEISPNVYHPKIVTRQQILDYLADQECCIVLSSAVFPDFCIRHISNPIAKTLENGDEMHFVPVELP